MDAILEQINSVGKTFIEFAVPMLIQSSVLIIILLALDLVLRKRIRAVFRYWIWMIVLVKLVLPPSLSLPTSPVYWLGDKIQGIVKQESSVQQESITYSPAIPERTFLSNDVTPPVNTIESTSNIEQEAVVQEISLSWQGFAFLIWSATLVIMVALLIHRVVFVKRLIAQSQKTNDEMNDILECACRQMGMRNKISLKLSDTVLSPSVSGLIRPMILIPKNIAQKIDSNDLKSILLHELAHIKRYDLWVNLLQTVLQIIYIYNPLLWTANYIIRNIREQAVDEMVLVAMGRQAEEYLKTLLNISRFSFGSAALSLRLIGVAESKKALVARIKHITGRPFPTSAKLGVLHTLIIIITASIFLPMARATERPPSTWDLIRQAQAQKADPNEPDQSTNSVQPEKSIEPEEPAEIALPVEPVKTQQVETQTGERILHFPKDHSLGKLYLYDKNKYKRFSYWLHGSWNRFVQDYFCEAKGDVNVPAGKKLCLYISYEGLRNLSPLTDLRPDDLYGISFDMSPFNLPAADVCDKAMSYITKLTGLKYLYLHMTNVTDEGMKDITNLKSLEILHLPDPATDISMAYVGRLTSLKRLFVNETGSLITDAGLQHIAQLKNLEELCLCGNEMGDNGLVYVKDLPKLEYLCIRGVNFGDRGMTHIKDMESLKMLTFYEGDSYISDAGLVDISEIPNLEYLYLHAMKNITDDGIAHLTRMKSLREINIESSQITDKGLLTLSRIKTLERLELPGPSKGFTDTGISSLGSLPNLKSLKITQSQRAEDYYTDKSLESLSKCKSLEELIIESPGITNAGLARLAELKSLRILFIAGSQITVSGINHLNSLTNLKRLDVYKYEPDGATLDLSGLTSLEKLRTYHLSDSGYFSDEDLKSLSGLKNLYWLHILPSDFTDKGISYLAGLTNMERLIIRGSEISDEGLKYLVNMKKLDLLSIDSNNITEQGLRYLGEIKSLRSLDITSDNDFRDAALRRLMNELPELYSLRINGARLEMVR